MRTTTIDKLCCPFDKNNLTLRVATREHDDILEGLLQCSKCERTYPIVYGIPIMSPDEYRDIKLEQPILEKMKKQLAGSD